MTYLNMVNNILKRLRERQVSSVTENSYSALIGVLINDAKKEVEDSWDWSALRTTLTATTSDGVYSSRTVPFSIDVALAISLNFVNS